MTIERQLDSEHQSSSETISEVVSDWLYQFIKHFQLNFIEISRDIPADAARIELVQCTLAAIVRTFEDAGFSREEALAVMAAVPSRSIEEPVNWTPELNERRFQLIDKQIDGTLSITERVELIRLTAAMRSAVESEANLPMEGARQLHQRLQELRTQDQELRRHPR